MRPRIRARCLEFHRTQRRVKTASLGQVRQPIYSRSVGRWRNYVSELDDLFRAIPAAGAHRAGEQWPGRSSRHSCRDPAVRRSIESRMRFSHAICRGSPEERPQSLETTRYNTMSRRLRRSRRLVHPAAPNRAGRAAHAAFDHRERIQRECAREHGLHDRAGPLRRRTATRARRLTFELASTTTADGGRSASTRPPG